MTTLSTHDTKRSEDVRARLVALAELAGDWAEAVRRNGPRPPRRTGPATACPTGDGLPGLADAGRHLDRSAGGPPSAERLTRYLDEGDPRGQAVHLLDRSGPAYDDAVADFARAVLGDEDLMAAVGRVLAR